MPGQVPAPARAGARDRGPVAPPVPPISWRPSQRAMRLLTAAVCALVPAIVFGAWWCVPLAAVPLLLLTAHGGSHPARIRAEADVPDRRCFEGETVTATIRLAADAAAGWTRQEYLPPRLRDFHEFDPTATPSGVRLESLELTGAVITVRLLVPRWGRWSLGAVAVDVYDTAGLRVAALQADLGEVEAFPVPAPDDTVLVPQRFPDRFGEHSARTPGEGVEFIAVRPYVFGDRQRRINWPATTRRRELQVNTFEAERAAEAVVVIDALSDLPQPPATEDLRPRSTLDIAVRGAAGLAQAYLKAHDRIGVVTLSGRVQWLTPGSGNAHLYRIAQTVMDLRKDFTYETGGLNRLPTRVLPRGALIYVFSPLLDPGVVEAIRDLADRGHPLVVIDVLAHEPHPTTAGKPDHLDMLALRLWRLDRQAVRFVLGELGVPVVNWDGVAPLDLALAPLLQMPVAGRAR
ncbi:DUF58 domain-containing protein [Catenulispora subtropica]|uniref:DUF58 domain-containing protein n=1 Tax=Catenulispora subtropica TaxID=450798 RepID=A0ABP5EFN8_9ACTN